MASSTIVKAKIEEVASAIILAVGPKTVRALDLGSSSRAWSLLLAERGFDVCAADKDRAALEVLRNKIKTRNPSLSDRIELLEADFLKDFPDGRFALILALNIFHLFSIEDQAYLLDKIASHLEPAGQLIVLAKKCWLMEQEELPGLQLMYSEEIIQEDENYLLKIFGKN